MRFDAAELRAKLVLTIAAAGCAWFVQDAQAQDVRLVQQNGAQFVESTQTVRQPMANTTVQQQEQTVYREEYITQMQESQQTYLAPVTEYRWEPRVHGRLNPFRQPTVQYHLVPNTRWEPRVHTVRTPLTTRQLRPETRVVQVPSRQLGFTQQQQTTRTALAPTGTTMTNNIAAAPTTTSVAARHHALPAAAPQGSTVSGATITGGQVVVPQMATRPNVTPGVIGGVHQMDGDHPRFGTSTTRY